MDHKIFGFLFQISGSENLNHWTRSSFSNNSSRAMFRQLARHLHTVGRSSTTHFGITTTNNTSRLLTTASSSFKSNLLRGSISTINNNNTISTSTTYRSFSFLPTQPSFATPPSNAILEEEESDTNTEITTPTASSLPSNLTLEANDDLVSTETTTPSSLDSTEVKEVEELSSTETTSSADTTAATEPEEMIEEVSIDVKDPIEMEKTAQEWRKKWSMNIKGKNETGDGPYVPPLPWCEFEEVEFTAKTKALMMSAGFTAPTPIQAQAWPVCMEGRDIVSVSRTGSGKTLGFLLPIFQKIRPSVRSMKPARRAKNNKRYNRNDRHVQDGEPPQALILAPTRELAVQIEKEVRIYGRSQGVRSVAVFGGDSKYRQIQEIQRSSPQVICATPGRLQDLCDMGALKLSNITTLVLDEADLMLDMGFKPQLEQILKYMPQQKNKNNYYSEDEEEQDSDKPGRHTYMFR